MRAVALSPKAGAKGAKVLVMVKVRACEALTPGSNTGRSVRLKATGATKSTKARVTYLPSTHTIRIVPAEKLAHHTTTS